MSTRKNYQAQDEILPFIEPKPSFSRDSRFKSAENRNSTDKVYEIRHSIELTKNRGSTFDKGGRTDTQNQLMKSKVSPNLQKIERLMEHTKGLTIGRKDIITDKQVVPDQQGRIETNMPPDKSSPGPYLSPKFNHPQIPLSPKFSFRPRVQGQQKDTCFETPGTGMYKNNNIISSQQPESKIRNSPRNTIRPKDAKKDEKWQNYQDPHNKQRFVIPGPGAQDSGKQTVNGYNTFDKEVKSTEKKNAYESVPGPGAQRTLSEFGDYRISDRKYRPKSLSPLQL